MFVKLVMGGRSGPAAAPATPRRRGHERSRDARGGGLTAAMWEAHDGKATPVGVTTRRRWHVASPSNEGSGDLHDDRAQAGKEA